MICPNCGQPTPKHKLTDERIAELWFQANHHLHKFARLLVKELNKDE